MAIISQVLAMVPDGIRKNGFPDDTLPYGRSNQSGARQFSFVQ